VTKIEVYTSPFCGFCHQAKDLLEEKGAVFNEINIVAEPNRHEEMLKRANGQRTVPQIFIDNNHIGGCDDLYSLNARGKLDALLKSD
jgi:glutaredoxin 3